MKIIVCAKLCASLYYSAGFPIEGNAKACFCADIVDKQTLPPLPITLKWIHPPEKESERDEDRSPPLYGPAE